MKKTIEKTNRAAPSADSVEQKKVEIIAAKPSADQVGSPMNDNTKKAQAETTLPTTKQESMQLNQPSTQTPESHDTRDNSLTQSPPPRRQKQSPNSNKKVALVSSSTTEPTAVYNPVVGYLSGDDSSSNNDGSTKNGNDTEVKDANNSTGSPKLYSTGSGPLNIEAEFEKSTLKINPQKDTPISPSHNPNDTPSDDPIIIVPTAPVDDQKDPYSSSEDEATPTKQRDSQGPNEKNADRLIVDPLQKLPKVIIKERPNNTARRRGTSVASNRSNHASMRSERMRKGSRAPEPEKDKKKKRKVGCKCVIS